MAGGRFSISATFKALDRISAPVRAMQSKLRGFGVAAAAALKGANEKATKFITGLRNVGLAAIAAAGSLALIGRSVVGTGMDFERTLMSAVARFPGEIERGTEAFEALRSAAENLGATTEFDAQQAAGALNVYAAAGFTAAQAIAVLGGTGDLATVGVMTLDDAAAIAADSLNTLGLNSDDAATRARNLTRVNDLLAVSTNLANMSVTDMSEAIKVGGAVTRNSGQSIETFGSLVAALANSGIRGSEAGTSIRNMMTRLQRPTERARTALRGLGVSVTEVVGGRRRLRDMADVMADLSSATARLGSADKNAALSTIFEDANLPAAMALMETGADRIRSMRTQLEGANGAAARMAGTMRDTTANDIDGFLSAIDGVKTALFGVVSGPLRQILQGTTEWVAANTALVSGGVQSFVEWLRDNIGTLAQRFAGIAFVIGTFAAIALGIKAATAAMVAFNFIMGLNPWVALAYGIIAAIGLIIAFWPEISAFFEQLWADIETIASDIGQWFSETWESVSSSASAMASAVGAFFSDIWASVTGAFSSASSTIGGVFAAIWEPIEGFFVGAFEFIVGVFTLIIRALRPIINPAIAILAGAAAFLITKWLEFKAAILLIWTTVSSAASMAWSTLVSIILGRIAQARSGIAFVWEWIKASVAGVAQTIATSFGLAWAGITGAARTMFDTLVGVFSPLVTFFSGIWNTIASAFTNTVGPMINTAIRIVDAIRGVGRETLDGEGDGEGAPQGGGRPSPQVVPPRTAPAGGTTNTNTNHTTAEVRVRADPGTQARVTRPPARGTPVVVRTSGAF